MQPGEEWEEAGEDACQPADLLYLVVCTMQPGEEWEEAGEDAGQPPDLFLWNVQVVLQLQPPAHLNKIMFTPATSKDSTVLFCTV